MVLTKSSDVMSRATVTRLVLLACATFVNVTFEMLPVGLISDLAGDLHVSESRIGLLVSGYAIVSAIVTIPSVALASRISRGSALTLSLIALILAEMLTCVAVDYPMMVVGRLIAALTHGLLWSLVTPAAAALVPPRKVGVATAIVFGGPSMAAVVGSPGTTYLGELIGWRLTTLVLAVITALVTVGVVWAVRFATSSAPQIDDATISAPGAIPAIPARWLAVTMFCGLTLVLVTAHFVSFTYFALIVGHAVQSGGAVVLFLAFFGVAGALGTYLIGHYSDDTPHRAAVVTLAAFLAGAVILTLGDLAAPTAIRCGFLFVAVVAWGGAYAAAGPVLQSGIIRVAGDQQDRASSIYVACYQVGIAGGAGIGAAVLGHSVTWLPWITATLGLALLGFVLRRKAAAAFSPDSRLSA